MVHLLALAQTCPRLLLSVCLNFVVVVVVVVVVVASAIAIAIVVAVIVMVMVMVLSMIFAYLSAVCCSVRLQIVGTDMVMITFFTFCPLPFARVTDCRSSGGGWRKPLGRPR